MNDRPRSIYYLIAQILVGMMLLSVLWEFLLEDLIVPFIYEAYHPEPTYERWEFILTALFFVTIALLIPSRLAIKNMRDADHARAALSSAYDDLEKRVQDRTRELVDANEQLKHAMEQQRQSEEALRKSEKELRLLSSQLLTAQENERRRVALDLHDNVSQTLIAMKFRIEHALVEFDGSKEKSAKMSKILIPVIQESIEEVRNMYMRLRPSILDDLGLSATLSWLWRDFHDTYPDIHIQSEINIADSEIPDDLKIVIFRVLQEGLNNVARHSEADQVRVTLTRTNDMVELTVEDNGVGFRLEEVLSVDDSLRGIGLSGMKERVELARGALKIYSEKGEGTKICASWLLTHDKSVNTLDKTGR